MTIQIAVCHKTGVCQGIQIILLCISNHKYSSLLLVVVCFKFAEVAEVVLDHTQPAVKVEIAFHKYWIYNFSFPDQTV